MTPSLKLADDQRFALMKLRRSVQDVLQPYHNDQFLLRWLSARKWDPTAAEKMLRDSLAWRKRWDVDQLQEWEEPKILRDHIPHGLSGYDKDGAPVIIVPFAGLDLYGILHVVTRKEMIKMTVKKLEDYLRICREQSEKYGPDASQCTVIFDMENFNLRPFMWRPAGELIIALIQMYEANYPEILKICYIINAPKVFAFAFSIAKKFMNEYTISKIQIYKSDPNKWKSAVLKLIPPDQLPVHFGGTLADPDGNPRYTTKICQGGKVPKNLYKNKGDAERNDEFTSAIIKKGDKLKLEFQPNEIGSLLSWEFHLDDHDIKFGVMRRGNDGSQKEVVPIHRVSPQQNDEVGLVTCDVAPAVYSVVFDNSYSLLRNKKIHYCIRVVPPSIVDEETLVKA